MKGTPKQIIDYLYYQDKDKVFEIKEFKKKRTLNQNNYYWELLGELSLALRLPPEELHKRMLKDYSQKYQIMIPYEIELRGIDYYDKKSVIEKNGNKFQVYEVYVPSHELKTKEFAILLDGLINECKQVGIETLTPDEISEMLASEV